jgi:hypothetical protein
LTTCFGEKLDELAYKFLTCINTHPGDVAAGPRQTLYDPSENRIARRADDWNCARFRLKGED